MWLAFVILLLRINVKVAATIRISLIACKAIAYGLIVRTYLREVSTHS
jgi:hypothetical protein